MAKAKRKTALEAIKVGDNQFAKWARDFSFDYWKADGTETIMFYGPGTTLLLAKPGDWIVRTETGDFVTYTDAAFITLFDVTP